MRAVFLILCFSTLLPGNQVKLMKVKVDDSITVKVPKGWHPMDDLDLTERYPSVRKPIVAYTDDNRESDFSVKISATQWPDTDLEMAQKFFKASLMNMFDRVEIIHEGVREVRKKKYIYFEFESRVNGNRQDESQRDPVLTYSYVQYLLQPDRTLVFNFNCPRRLRQEWQATAEEMMTEIVVK